MTKRAVHQTPVFLVHGLWAGRWTLLPLRRRMRNAGFRVHNFGYPTTRRDFHRSAQNLATAIMAGAETEVAVIAHSFGGLLTLAAIPLLPATMRGRVVLLGTPITGSRVAHRIWQWPGGTWMLGQALRPLLQGAALPDPTRWSVAMVAGTRRFGLGVVAGGGRWPGDGTVLLRETWAEGLADYLKVTETHTSMLLSPRVARAALHFLCDGHFGNPAHLRRGGKLGEALGESDR